MDMVLEADVPPLKSLMRLSSRATFLVAVVIANGTI